MMNIEQIVISVIIFIVALFAVKRLAGCLTKAVLLIVIATVLIWLYFDMNAGSFDKLLSIFK